MIFKPNILIAHRRQYLFNTRVFIVYPTDFTFNSANPKIILQI